MKGKIMCKSNVKEMIVENNKHIKKLIDRVRGEVDLIDRRLRDLEKEVKK